MRATGNSRRRPGHVGRYLDTLEQEYALIQKMRPMWAKPNSQGVKYFIQDCFLNFWFRFIESNRSIIELGKFDLLEEAIRKEYVTYSGSMLEKYFRQKYGEMERVTEVSHWWDSQGQNEIDLIAIEKLDKRATVAEVKRNIRKYSSTLLQEKYKQIQKYLRGYEVSLIGLSMEEM